MTNGPLSSSGVVPRAPLLTCRVEDEHGIAVICCSGEIDLSTVPILKAEMERLADPVHDVIVDLGDVVYCDMSGVRLLEDCDNYCRSRGRRLMAVIPPGIVRRVFEFVGATNMLQVADTREQAHAVLRGS